MIAKRIALALGFLLVQSTSPCWAKAKSRYVSVGVSHPSLTLAVDNVGADDAAGPSHSIDYQPKDPTVVFLGARYGGISASISDSVGSDSKQLDYTDYRFSYFFSWIGFDVGYTEFERFRITDSKGFDTELEDRELHRGDLSVTFASANAYLFPLRYQFDLNRAFDPSLVKGKSGVGLGVVGSYYLTEIETELGFVPADWQPGFGSDGQFAEGSLMGSGIQAALAGTLALGHTFFSVMFAAGAGKHEFEYDAVEQTRTGTGTATKITTRISTGYSGKSMFAAIEATEESPDYELRHMTINTTRFEASALVGMKF